MATIGGNNSEQDGLVFHYDTGNKLKSYRGEPTVNLAENKQQAENTYGYQAGYHLYEDAPERGKGWKKVTINHTGDNSNAFKLPYITHTDLQTRTYSIEYDFNGKDNIYSWNLGGYGANATETHTGFYISTTYTPTDGGGNLSLILTHTYPIQTVINDVIYYRNYQVEQKPHPTPFTPNSRSTTESLLDLTGNAAIDLSNVSFDVNAHPYFDGIDNGITLPLELYQDIALRDVTISLVAKIDGSFTRDNDLICVDFHGANVPILIWYDFGNKTIAGLVNDGLVYTGVQYGITNAVVSNTFYEVTAVINPTGNLFEIYLNGEIHVRQNINYSGIELNNSLPFFIGKGSNNGSNTKGQIPIAKIYNKALTAQQVKQNFQAIRSRFGI